MSSSGGGGGGGGPRGPPGPLPPYASLSDDTHLSAAAASRQPSLAQSQPAQPPGPHPLTAEVVGPDLDLEARELAAHETDAVAVLGLDMAKMNLVDIAKHENNLSPRSGPFSPERNMEVFRALLYLMDAEKKKRPNVVDDCDAMKWYYARKKTSWKLCLGLACCLYVLVSLTELPAFGVRAPRDEGKEWYEILLEAICNVIFVFDICMQGRAKGFGVTWRNRWTQIFAVLLAFDFLGVIWQGLRLLKVTGIVRAFPIVYYSKRARNAMINYSKTLPSVMLWIALELFVIVLYSCVTVVMYAHLDRAGQSGQTAFEKFSSAFISLYSLSLTVNDPDVYLPYYELNFCNVLIFASFMIITFFMIHNIILSRIFQIYSDKLKETALKRRENRHKALFLAFEALDEHKSGVLPKDLLAYVLKRLRPKYSDKKIETLMKITNKRRPHEYNFEQFELLMGSLDNRVSKIRRTDFYPSYMQKFLDGLTVSHLLLVLGSMIEYWSFFYTTGFWVLIWFFRVLFTADVVYRVKRCGALKYFLKDNFNVLNVLAILFSFAAFVAWTCALVQDQGVLTLEPYTRGKAAASLFILLASCCDMCRIFARVPEYSALLTVFNKLFPAFVGQATVVFTMMHVFCYIGMYIFGGRITATDPMWAERDFAGNLYYLLNFNTYKDGMVTLFMLLIVNNWNLISANFVEVTTRGAYLYFMAFQIAVVTIGLNCVTSFFIGNLSNKLSEELEHQAEERRKKKEEAERAKANGLDPLSEHVIRFKVERRVSSDDLMLTDEEPVDAAEYRALLEAMMREQGDRTGYSFVKENADTEQPETIQRSPYFVEIVERYGGELPILTRVKALFKEEGARQQAREERGAADPLQAYFVVEDRLSRVTSTGGNAVLHLRVMVLTEGEQLLAYCQIKEEGGGSGGGDGGHGHGHGLAAASSPVSYIRR